MRLASSAASCSIGIGFILPFAFNERFFLQCAQCFYKLRDAVSISMNNCPWPKALCNYASLSGVVYVNYPTYMPSVRGPRESYRRIMSYKSCALLMYAAVVSSEFISSLC